MVADLYWPAAITDSALSMPPKPYRVLNSVENEERNRCVDIVLYDDGGFGFQEWRREPEDPGNWSMLSGGGAQRSESEEQAVTAARLRVPWFATLQQR